MWTISLKHSIRKSAFSAFGPRKSAEMRSCVALDLSSEDEAMSQKGVVYSSKRNPGRPYTPGIG